MQFDVSFGRHTGPPSRLPTFVTISPGWWRLEWGPLAIEVDNQPTSTTVYALACALTAAFLALLLWSRLP